MQLLDDIINELIVSDNSIVTPLLKTKVLASRINNQALLTWVDSELKGYEASEVPDYRITSAKTTMTYIQGNHKVSGQALPTFTMSDKTRSFFNDFKFQQTAATLQAYADNEKDGTLSVQMPAEAEYYVQEMLKNLGNPYIEVMGITKEVSPNAAVEILAILRNRLLDFLLEVEKQFGKEVTIESLRAKSQLVTTIMYNTITNNGDGNVVNTGNEAIQNTSLTIMKNSLDDLTKKLQNNKVSDVDISELVSVIGDDSIDTENKRFGPKVNIWIGKMIQKSLDGSWEIGIATAGGVLTEILKSYYGI